MRPESPSGPRPDELDGGGSSLWLWSIGLQAPEAPHSLSVCVCVPALRLQVYEADGSQGAPRSLTLRSGCSRRSLSCRSLSCNRNSSVSLHTLTDETEDEEQLCGLDQNQGQARTSAFGSRVVRTPTSLCSIITAEGPRRLILAAL